MVMSTEIVELWCGDCAAERLFDRLLPADELSVREWACMTCGAAYIESWEGISAEQPSVRGVA